MTSVSQTHALRIRKLESLPVLIQILSTSYEFLSIIALLYHVRLSATKTTVDDVVPLEL